MTDLLVGITGFKGSGKSTAVRPGYYDGSWYNVLSLADGVKEAARYILNGEHVPKRNCTHALYLYGESELREIKIPGRDYTYRQMLQHVGHQMRTLDPNIWIRLLTEHMERYCVRSTTVSHNITVVPDVRYQNEVDYIKDEGGIVIRIIRPGIVRTDNHITEDVDSLQGIDDDHVVINDSDIPDLRIKVKKVIEHYLWNQ